MNVEEWKQLCIAYFESGQATPDEWSLMADCLLCVSEDDGLGELDNKILAMKPPNEPLRCPECNSRNYWLDGDWDQATGEKIAEYMLCRDCGHSGPSA